MGVSVLFGDLLPCYSAVRYLSWSAGALLFGICLPYFLFIVSFFRFSYLFFIPCAPKRSGPCISFFLFLLSNLSMSSDSYFCFYYSTITALLCYFLEFPFYFLLSPVVPVVQVYISLYLLALVVGFPYFRVVAFCFWGSLFDILLVLFEPISLFLVSFMWPVLMCIILVVVYLVRYWDFI